MNEKLHARLDSFKDQITKLEAHRDFLARQQEHSKQEADRHRHIASLNQKSSEILKSWLEDFLKNNIDSISELATSGLRYVVDDQKLTFNIKQELKYNRLSMRFVIEEDGVEGDPMASFGGGAVLTASLILRLAIMARLKMGNLLLLDETMYALANRYIPSASDFMRKLSEDMGINILMVTHNDEFMRGAHVSYDAFLEKSNADDQVKKRLRLRKRPHGN